jgi:predicted O-methyltransferase YrrM
MAVDEQAVILATLAESIARPGCRLLEVGSWCGDSTMVLGEVAKRHGGHLYCIDWWKGNIGTDLEKIAEQHDVFSVFWQRVCKGGLEDVVIPMRGKSEHISTILAPGTFDLIYIDADHRYESVCQDLASFAPLVRDGGVFCGDDCEGRIADFDPEFLKAGKNRDTVESVHCGVVLAVGQAFENYAIDYNIWSVRRAGSGWRPPDIEFPGIRRKRQYSPPLIESHAGYNLVRYGRFVYAIPQALGPVDITEEETRGRPEILLAGC